MLFLKNIRNTLNLILIYFLFSFSYAQVPPSTNSFLKIFILQNTEHPALDATRHGFLDELRKLGYEEGKNLMLQYQSAQGNSALAAQIAQKFISDHPNVIVAIGTKSAQAAMMAAKRSETPVVFSSVTDPLTAKLVTNLETPDGYVTGVSNFVKVVPQFKLFKKLLPHLRVLGNVYDPGEPNSVALLSTMEQAAKELGLRMVNVTASKTSEVMAASQSLCGKVDAIFINNDSTALAAFKSVVKAAQGCDIPTFVSDVDLVEEGALAALGPNQVDIGRQTARMVDFIIKNPTAPLPSVEFPEKTEEHVRPS